MGSKIVFVTPFPAAADTAREMLPTGFELVVAEAPSPAFSDAMAEAEYLVGFVDRLVDDELYRTSPHLKLIQLLSAGYDRADIAAARKAGIPIANNGGANSVAVSEHAVMLMLAVSRGLVRQHASVVAGNWRGNDAPELYELRDKTLGIVGFGAIGKKTARLAKAFGMRVVYFDVMRLSEADEDALGVRFRLLRELVREADVISLHMPLNDATHHIIGKPELDEMKPTAIIVNTGRGPLIDEAALVEALSTGGIAGAGLDVFDPEPPEADNPLFALSNVILTPHVAGPTLDSNAARVRNAFDNVQRVARGASPLWIIPELSA